ncbi:RNA-binding motif protein, X-linked 2-like [Palaemon carinicauda]|uniref:RNA-binding motif protein, X-linked 2-like n=1 Tax=Palaemon carinicauda TaxID=392227 RepID=UPI0035B6A479
MNPLTNVKNIQKLSQKELELGVSLKHSWHQQYRDSAWVFIGGLNYDLTEGDIICVFSQYGEIVNVNLVRDKKSGKSKGFAFLCYEDQRSTILAVDNLNGIKLVGRIIRVDHVEEYKVPKMSENMSTEQQALILEGCAPQLLPAKKEETPPASFERMIKTEKVESHKVKKEKSKKKRKMQESSSSSSSDDSSLSSSSSSSEDSDSNSFKKKHKHKLKHRKHSSSEDSDSIRRIKKKRKHKSKTHAYDNNVPKIKEEKRDLGYEKYESTNAYSNQNLTEKKKFLDRGEYGASRSHFQRDSSSSSYKGDSERSRGQIYENSKKQKDFHSKEEYHRDRKNKYYDDYKRDRTRSRSRSREKYRNRY